MSDSDVMHNFRLIFPKPKESYAFVFTSMHQADFWMRQTSVKLHSQIIFRYKDTHRIEFEDSTYYFLSQSQFDKIRGIKFDYIYSGDAIYIILDDPERLRIQGDTQDNG